MRWRWPWRRHVDTTEEACAALAELEQRDEEITDLGKELRAAQQRNHFSIAVHDAIRRTREN